MTEKATEIEVVTYQDAVKVTYDGTSVEISQDGNSWRETQVIYLNEKVYVQRMIAALQEALEKIE
ncbi:hypothetical protein FY137_06965 [Agrobacterium tumefaciens]|nr:hypothetical protein FY137_06965 [Agrobacterium tumefaciens]